MVTVTVIIIRTVSSWPGLLALGVGAIALALAAPFIAATFTALAVIAWVAAGTTLALGAGYGAFKAYQFHEEMRVQRILAKSFAQERSAYVRATERIALEKSQPIIKQPIQVEAQRVDRP